MKIVCFHLLNDYSGSPHVLSQVIRGFVSDSFEIDLYTSGVDQKGFLSDLYGVNTHHFSYRFSRFKLVSLFLLFISQLSLFFRLLKYNREKVTFYVNTVLPFGAALAGWIMNKRVIYHFHETSIKPKPWKKFLFWIARLSANDGIYVSNYLRDKEASGHFRTFTIYNALTYDFFKQAYSFNKEFNGVVRGLMICSLKAYKGVNEFVYLARMIPEMEFDLVLNASNQEIEKYFSKFMIPENLHLHPAQKDVHPFYREADLVFNLSLPFQWVETFGLTVLEAMSYGIPVIIPTVGGITELVAQGENGYRINAMNLDEIHAKIHELIGNESLYKDLSTNARNRSMDFSFGHMYKQIKDVIEYSIISHSDTTSPILDSIRQNEIA